MPAKDPRVDAYIAKASDVAKPMLRFVRDVVHDACPDVEETLKWGVPFFVHQGPLCGMAGFKAHAAVGFWKGSLVVGADGRTADEAIGKYVRLTSVADLPPKKVLAEYVKAAARLNETGVKRTVKKRAVKVPAMPTDLRAALARSRKAKAAFAAFSPSNKRDYIEWITDAKGDDTRRRRIATAVEWIAEGKPRNWKYMKQYAR